MSATDYDKLLQSLRHPAPRVVPRRHTLPPPVRGPLYPGTSYTIEDIIRDAERLPRIGQQTAARIATRICLPPVVAWLRSRNHEMAPHVEPAVAFYEDLLATSIPEFETAREMREYHYSRVHRALINSMRSAGNGSRPATPGGAANAAYNALTSMLRLHVEGTPTKPFLQDSIERAFAAYESWHGQSTVVRLGTRTAVVTPTTPQWQRVRDFASIWSAAIRASLPVCFCHYRRADLRELLKLIGRRSWRGPDNEFFRRCACLAEQLARTMAPDPLPADPRYQRTQHEVDAYVSAAQLPSRLRWAATALATAPRLQPYNRILLTAALALEPVGDSFQLQMAVLDALESVAVLVSGHSLADDGVYSTRQVEVLAAWWQMMRRHSAMLHDHDHTGDPLDIATGYAPVSA